LRAALVQCLSEPYCALVGRLRSAELLLGADTGSSAAQPSRTTTLPVVDHNLGFEINTFALELVSISARRLS
jgi:hypothetical protein